MTTTTWKAPPIVRRGMLSTLGKWLGRVALLLPAMVMTRVGVRYIIDPVHAASSTGVSLTTPEALTDTRVVGGLALTVVFVIATTVFSARRIRWGHATVAVMMAVILAVRLFGFAHDGTTLATGDQTVKTVGEIVFLTLNLLFLIVQTRTTQREPSR